MRGLSFMSRSRPAPWLISKLSLTRYSPMILAAVPSCAAGVQSSSSTPTYRKHNSTPHAGHAQPAVYRSRSSRM